MTPQDALESAISDYAALNYGQIVGEREMAEHIIQHMREHHGYIIWRTVTPSFSMDAQHAD
jgi:hypothetical protein